MHRFNRGRGQAGQLLRRLLGQAGAKGDEPGANGTIEWQTQFQRKGAIQPIPEAESTQAPTVALPCPDQGDYLLA